MSEKGKTLDVFTIVEQGGDRRSIWVRIGAAFVNRDDSLTIALNALPTNGRLHVRERGPQHQSTEVDS